MNNLEVNTTRDFVDIIRNRRSIRSYHKEQIKDEELQTILDAGIWAPSAHNTQPWHFTVIQDQSLIEHISDSAKQAMADSPIHWIARMGKRSSSIFYDAPTVIIVSGKKYEKFNLEPAIDCAAAIQNILLTAELLNIGSCWIGLASYFFRQPDKVQILNIPLGYQPFHAVCLGYKALNLNNMHGPKRKSEIITYIRSSDVSNI
jgi:nitroreductase